MTMSSSRSIILKLSLRLHALCAVIVLALALDELVLMLDDVLCVK